MENEKKPNFFQNIGAIIKKKKILFIIIASVLALVIAAGVCSFIFFGDEIAEVLQLGGIGSGNKDKDKNENKETVTYTVSLETKGGIRLRE